MITPAQTEDAAALSELVNSAYRGDSSRQGWTTEADFLDGTRTDIAAIEELLGKADTTVLKYEASGKILGCMELRQQNNKLYLGMLTVQPALQGKGIGKKLLEAAENEARNKKCQAIYMTVISIRKELVDWYVRHGYHDTGERKPFSVPDVRWGVPRIELEFAVLEKLVVSER